MVEQKKHFVKIICQMLFVKRECNFIQRINSREKQNGTDIMENAVPF